MPSSSKCHLFHARRMDNMYWMELYQLYLLLPSKWYEMTSMFTGLRLDAQEMVTAYYKPLDQNLSTMKCLSRTADVPFKCANVFLFLHWLYIPGWDLSSSMSFCHFSLDCALVLQFLQPTCAKSSSNLLHHLNFGLPLLSPFPPGLVQRTFFAG